MSARRAASYLQLLDDFVALLESCLELRKPREEELLLLGQLMHRLLQMPHPRRAGRSHLFALLPATESLRPLGLLQTRLQQLGLLQILQTKAPLDQVLLELLQLQLQLLVLHGLLIHVALVLVDLPQHAIHRSISQDFHGLK